MSYLMVDDESLFDEMIESVSDLIYQGVNVILDTGAEFDFAHFWEDIAYKTGHWSTPGCSMKSSVLIIEKLLAY